MESPSVLVLGDGAIGRALVDALRAPLSCVCLVNVADPHINDVHAFPVDVLAEPNLIKNYQYVINTIPLHDPEKLAPLLVACLRHGIHYLDTNEDRTVGRFVRLLGDAQTDILVAPHCGLAPGLINVLGGHMLRAFVPVSIDLRVGAMTRLIDNEWLYVPTWSPAGMVNQSLNDFEIIDKSKVETHTSIFSREAQHTFGHFHRFYHDFYLDGVHYECFPTGGGLGTMTDLAGSDRHKLESLMYRTIRLYKHAEAFRTAVHAYGFDRDKLVNEFNKYRVHNVEDMVVVIARCGGPSPDQQYTFIAKTTNGVYLGTPMTAIQKCTVAGVAAVLDLHIQGKIPSGFLHHHNIDWTNYAASQYVRALNFQWSM